MRVNHSSKKTRLLVVCLLACTILTAQQNQISEIVRIDFPARTVKVSKAELKSMVNERKKDSLLMPLDTNREYYSIDSILLTLHGERWSAPKNYLDNRRKDFEIISTTEMSCNCTSEVRNINNYSVLITNIDSRDWGVYFFSSVNRKSTAILNGSLYYLKDLHGDKAKAFKVLNELLDNIAYKL